ncbi:MAG: Na+/H+ antiporter NhaC family protein [Bacillota bacterium]|jgi:Na+/H+ antiporter NhaC|nr:Na+/H+ antiporter NhaC family protein [Bacillota bacterium]
MEGTYGIISLIPIIAIVVLALITKQTFISIFVGVVVGFVILAGGNPLETFNLFLDGLYQVLMDETTVWVLLLCALFGSLIALMQDSGGVLGFANLAQRFIKGRKASVIGAWILGIIVFVDDYLNCLAVGAATRPITDKYRVSREMLAYIVNSTGVTVCAIIPFSTWGAFMSGQMEAAGMTGELSAFAAYTATAPFVLYGWIAVILVPFFATGILPLFGPMKEAEQRTLETGKVLSDVSSAALIELPEEEKAFEGKKCRSINFIAPIIVVAILTITTEDIVIALFAAILLCFVMYLPQRLLSFNKFFDSVIKGMVDMFPVLILIIMAYTLMVVNDGLGLTDFVIQGALKALNPALLPVTIFVVISLLSFGSGSFWGLAAISFPIIAPLADALGANPFLCAGALVSAVCAGGHICIYSDTVILTSASTQVTPAEYFRTSLPFILVAYVISIIGFLVLGFIM